MEGYPPFLNQRELFSRILPASASESALADNPHHSGEQGDATGNKAWGGLSQGKQQPAGVFVLAAGDQLTYGLIQQPRSALADLFSRIVVP